jgi:hypothetical protein
MTDEIFIVMISHDIRCSLGSVDFTVYLLGWFSKCSMSKFRRQVLLCKKGFS